MLGRPGASPSCLPPRPAPRMWSRQPAVSGEWAAVTQREGALAACAAAAVVRGGAFLLPAYPGLPRCGAESLPHPHRPGTLPRRRSRGRGGCRAWSRPVLGAVPAAAMGTSSPPPLPPADAGCARAPARPVLPRWAPGGGGGVGSWAGGARWRSAAWREGAESPAVSAGRWRPGLSLSSPVLRFLGKESEGRGRAAGGRCRGRLIADAARGPATSGCPGRPGRGQGSRAASLPLRRTAAVVWAAPWKGAAAFSALRGALAWRPPWAATQRLLDWEVAAGPGSPFVSPPHASGSVLSYRVRKCASRGQVTPYRVCARHRTGCSAVQEITNAGWKGASARFWFSVVVCLKITNLT